jgi:hypothetical protein
MIDSHGMVVIAASGSSRSHRLNTTWLMRLGFECHRQVFCNSGIPQFRNGVVMRFLLARSSARHGDEHPMKLGDEMARLFERLAKDLYERRADAARGACAARPEVSRDDRASSRADALAGDGAGRRSSGTATRAAAGSRNEPRPSMRRRRASPARRPGSPRTVRSRSARAFARRGAIRALGVVMGCPERRNTSAWVSDGVAPERRQGGEGYERSLQPPPSRASGLVVESAAAGAAKSQASQGRVGWQTGTREALFAGTRQRCAVTVMDGFWIHRGRAIRRCIG